jgi:hypothetical protein
MIASVKVSSSALPIVSLAPSPTESTLTYEKFFLISIALSVRLPLTVSLKSSIVGHIHSPVTGFLKKSY